MFDKLSNRLRAARNARRSAQLLSDRNQWNDRFAPRHIDEMRARNMMRDRTMW